MSGTGGSIEALTLNGRTFSVPADADVSRKLGGFENEIQVNGDGTIRLIKTRVAWSLSDLPVSVDDLNADHEFLQDLADLKAPFPVTITFASGVIMQGTGAIVGEMTVATQATTASLSLMGQGRLTQQ